MMYIMLDDKCVYIEEPRKEKNFSDAMSITVIRCLVFDI